MVELLGLKLVLADVDPSTYNIDIPSVEKAITPRTKAIVPVHLFGQCAPMEPLMTLAERHGISVVEDTAQATGATYSFSDGTAKKAGTIGIIGRITSYNVCYTKLLRYEQKPYAIMMSYYR